MKNKNKKQISDCWKTVVKICAILGINISILKYYSVGNTFDTNVQYFCIAARTVLWILVFFGFWVNYMLRNNINIAIVAMVKEKTSNNTLLNECATTYNYTFMELSPGSSSKHLKTVCKTCTPNVFPILRKGSKFKLTQPFVMFHSKLLSIGTNTNRG